MWPAALELGELRKAAGAHGEGLSLAFALNVMEANGGLGVEEGRDLVGSGEQNTASRVEGGRAVSKP